MCLSIQSYVLTLLSGSNIRLSCPLNVIQSVSYSEESIAFSSVRQIGLNVLVGVQQITAIIINSSVLLLPWAVAQRL